MHNFDRGMIKWQPFNSVVSSKELVKDILKEKKKSKMPLLSSEQRETIEQRIINAFFEKETITIVYHYQGNNYQAKGKIKKIDSIYHKIYFQNIILRFEQIINIY